MVGHERERGPETARDNRVGSHTHSDVMNACSLMVCSTSRNLILEVRVWPW